MKSILHMHTHLWIVQPTTNISLYVYIENDATWKTSNDTARLSRVPAPLPWCGNFLLIEILIENVSPRSPLWISRKRAFAPPPSPHMWAAAAACVCEFAIIIGLCMHVRNWRLCCCCGIIERCSADAAHKRNRIYAREKLLAFVVPYRYMV